MRQAVAILLCVLLVHPADLVGDARFDPIAAATELIKRPYLELLELDKPVQFSRADVETSEKQLKKESEAEQDRLKKEEQRIGKELKSERDLLQELNKRASRDDVEAAKQRTEIHCHIADLESQLARVKTEREKGVPISFQNKLAKLELIQKWPSIRSDIERKIEEGRAVETASEDSFPASDSPSWIGINIR